MKTLFAVILCAVFLITAGCAAAKVETTSPLPEEPVKISSLSEEECIDFLASHGVTIPEELDRIDVLSLVERLESRLDVPQAIGWTVLYNFCEQVRGVLMEHYGVSGELYLYPEMDA